MTDTTVTSPRLVSITVSDVRSIGTALQLRLGDVTTVVGPNQAGKSNLLFALVVALDDRRAFDPERDRRRGSVDPSTVVLETEAGSGAVTWPGGTRTVDASVAGLTGPVLHAAPLDALSALLEREAIAADDFPTVVEHVTAEAKAVVPDVAEVAISRTDDRIVVTVTDVAGFPVEEATGLRGPATLGLARALAALGRAPRAVLIDQPEAFLHPAAQELLRHRFEALHDELGIPVVITTESPFTLSRRESAKVVAVARDEHGSTRIVGGTRGSEPQATLLGGLFRDPGFAGIIDRTTRLEAGVRGVLILEGGTDEAYLRLAADILGRADELADIAIQPAGGAMAAALAAIVLRAETHIPFFVLLDNDAPGQKSKAVLVSRFGFTNRKEVSSYAEVLDGNVDGAEAEDVFDWRFMQRFVDERGEHTISGKKLRYNDVWHYDLTSEAKSAFVGHVREHATVEDVGAWGKVLDVIADRLP